MRLCLSLRVIDVVQLDSLTNMSYEMNGERIMKRKRNTQRQW